MPAHRLTVEQFWAKTDRTTGCWLWTGPKDHKGYGLARFGALGRKTFRAHRLAWMLANGRWPMQTIDHLCRVKHCLNPDHMEDVPIGVNVGRAPNHNLAKTHCKFGHPFTGRNLTWNGTARNCMACNYIRKGYQPSWNVSTGL